MPQSLSQVLIHLVFSTKHREPWILTEIESELHAYCTTVVTNTGCPAVAIGGMADHIHVLFQLSRVRTIADVVEELKTSSSKWIKTKGVQFQGFHWQTGYAALSVGQSGCQQTIDYIRNQQEHHRVRSFQDELRLLMKKHQVEFDERYVWD